MNYRTKLRNGLVAAFVICVIFLVAARQVPASAAPLAQANTLTLVGEAPPIAQSASAAFRFSLALSSAEAVARTFTITTSNSGGVTSTFPSGNQITVNPGSNVEFEVVVTVPSNAVSGAQLQQTITANSSNPSSLILSRPFVVVVAGNTPTPSPSATGTAIPPTQTPTPGPVCADGFEHDNNPASARRIDVNTAQQRTMCPTGDEDWIYFGGVGGKVYTIDVSRQDPGLDLSLELFDPNFNQIAFNDDFFLRDPANPNPGDTRPRITIRIPYDGSYYIRVRDTAGRGGVDYFYVIALLDESYGPTPTQVDFVCLDLFEPDGLPEQARLITSNEIQENRSLCPEGDADWVTFFGKTGKRYIIYTDTRRYRGRIVVNGETQAGADTVLVLTDRDGVSMLDFNDDIPGGNTLDSQIEFIPEVDGFYFIQIKNVGDIGNQFIRYDLVLLLCLPGQTDCGRTTITDAPINPITPQPTGTPDREFSLDPTNTPVPVPPTPTPTPVP
ncbi:MAG: peptidase [Candidatus Viridilinea halotolerans]|uniref:Peptidase n=1 Tax=Candidatus Viridilinea halotolerans TaxID=2491704 RepID=A0A426TU47_9CHLR|nr:MAG: peptidase [Candidatus Viridilinea halotolerans]